MMNDLLTFIITIAPAVGSVLATVLSALLAIKKVASIINEFKQSNELKQNNEQIQCLLKDNAQLKKLNEKLLVELTRIKPLGWTDSDDKN